MDKISETSENLRSLFGAAGEILRNVFGTPCSSVSSMSSAEMENAIKEADDLLAELKKKETVTIAEDSDAELHLDVLMPQPAMLPLESPDMFSEVTPNHTPTQVVLRQKRLSLDVVSEVRAKRASVHEEVAVDRRTKNERPATMHISSLDKEDNQPVVTLQMPSAMNSPVATATAILQPTVTPTPLVSLQCRRKAPIYEMEMWTKCRKLFGNHNNIYVHPSLWGNRDGNKKRVEGVFTSPKKMRLELWAHFKLVENAVDRKSVIFLVVSEVVAANKQRLVHSNVLIAQLENGKLSLFLFDPFQPSVENHHFLPMKFVCAAAKEMLRAKDDRMLNVVFGKQDESMDCFHRCIDFIARLTNNDISIAGISWMQYKIGKITNHTNKRVEIPLEFHMGI